MNLFRRLFRRKSNVFENNRFDQRAAEEVGTADGEIHPRPFAQDESDVNKHCQEIVRRYGDGDGGKNVDFKGKLEDMEQISVERNKPADDLIGREFGNHNEARNRVHIFRQPFGYPIRLCDWVAVDREKIGVYCHVEGPTGPAETERLKRALEYEAFHADLKGGPPICKTCLAIVNGKRECPIGPLMGELDESQ